MFSFSPSPSRHAAIRAEMRELRLSTWHLPTLLIGALAAASAASAFLSLASF